MYTYNPSFLGRLRQEDHKVKISLGYIAKQGLKTKWQDFIGSRVGGRSRWEGKGHSCIPGTAGDVSKRLRTRAGNAGSGLRSLVTFLLIRISDYPEVT